jgi:hypothetical protein
MTCWERLHGAATSGAGLVHARLVSARNAVFVFESGDPPVVDVYEDLEEASGSYESLDVPWASAAFLETGQVVTVMATDDVFASFHVTERFDLEELRSLLRRVAGPSHLADDPAAYAQELLRLDSLDVRRPPFIPRWLYDRFVRRGAPASDD